MLSDLQDLASSAKYLGVKRQQYRSRRMEIGDKQKKMNAINLLHNTADHFKRRSAEERTGNDRELHAFQDVKTVRNASIIKLINFDQRYDITLESRTQRLNDK